MLPIGTISCLNAVLESNEGRNTLAFLVMVLDFRWCWGGIPRPVKVHVEQLRLILVCQNQDLVPNLQIEKVMAPWDFPTSGDCEALEVAPMDGCSDHPGQTPKTLYILFLKPPPGMDVSGGVLKDVLVFWVSELPPLFALLCAISILFLQVQKANTFLLDIVLEVLQGFHCLGKTVPLVALLDGLWVSDLLGGLLVGDITLVLDVPDLH